MLLKADNIKKGFQSGDIFLEVLRGVDLEISRNQFAILTGRSGSGKSTLLYILGGLIKPDEGALVFNDEKLSGFDPGKLDTLRNRKIGFVFQMHHLMPDFTALENAIIPAMIGGMSQDEAVEKANILLTDLDIYSRRDHFPNQLSGGELQRAAVARAMINSPELILADEPTGNLDRENAESLIKLLKNLVETTNVSVLVATHNPELAGMSGKNFQLIDGKINLEKS